MAACTDSTFAGILDMDMDIGLGQIVDKIWTVGLEPMLIYFIDKIWTKNGHFFVQGLSNVKNLKQGDIF